MGSLAVADQTPEQRRDDAIAQIITAGGIVYSTDSLADPSDPATVVAYRINAGAPDLETLDRMNAVQEATQVDLSGLVPAVETGW